MNNDTQLEQYDQVAHIKVIGVGGAGNNAVNRMIEAGVQGVDFIVANTDAQVLSVSKAREKIILGKQLTKGLGAGANPEIGKQAAIETEPEIKKMLENSDMVFIAAGMGGGTGTGAAPIIARIAKDLGALTIAIVTRPFTFEGRLRSSYAVQGIEELRKHVDSLIIISNDKLLQVIGGVPLTESFNETDNILRQGVQTITDLIAVPALINLDFADVKTVIESKGSALFGIGIGTGENKAIEAANKAISSPLLEASIKGAQNAIVNVTGGNTMSLFDANDAVDIVRQAAGSEVNIIFGVAVNEHLDDEMIVTVIATGFDERQIEKANPQVIEEARLKRFRPVGAENLSNFGYEDDQLQERSVIYKPQRVGNFKPSPDGLQEELSNDDDLPPFLRGR
ncbi:cell division protein FtsZ [Spiroplasma endosymbiont of Tipula paludosa]|uniref:cell division protein FtsZ n=1 Tax=Spiroplasma endosymbiont of Tipula paludosa TaxID=3066295 RepID=UPI0035C8D51C